MSAVTENLLRISHRVASAAADAARAEFFRWDTSKIVLVHGGLVFKNSISVFLRGSGRSVSEKSSIKACFSWNLEVFHSLLFA